VLLGLNGAGKTTLFSLISHLYDTRHGTIRVFGNDVTRQSGEALRRLGGGFVICQFGGRGVPDEGDLKPLASVLECPLFLVR